ncbi:MAG: DUF4595 domain-containing protein [Prevotella sp.]|nr:DUF4595 domain-containing protein [Prevotella sp.]
MKKLLFLITMLLLSVATFAGDFDIVGTWYEYEWDIESLDGIWIFKSDKTGTCEEFHKGVSEGVGNFKYDFNASTNVLTVWNEGEEDDPVVFPIRIDSPTQFTYSEGRESLVWIKQEQSSGAVSHAISPKAASFKLASSKDGLTYYFAYDDQDSYSNFNIKSDKEAYEVNLSYDASKILIQYFQYGALVTSEMTLKGDHVVKEVVSIANDNQTTVFNTIDYTYDVNNQLVKVVTKSDFDPSASNEINISWENGNIKSANISGSVITSNVEFDYYTDNEDQSLVNAFSGSVAAIFDETEVVTFAPLFYCANYFGASCKNLTKSVKRSGSNAKEGSFNKTINLSYEYESNGLVKQCNYGNKIHQYSWVSGSDIAPQVWKSLSNETVFSLDGRHNTTIQRGLNIVRRSDGTVVKILK